MDGLVSSSKSMLVCTKLRDYVTAKNLFEHFSSVHSLVFQALFDRSNQWFFCLCGHPRAVWIFRAVLLCVSAGSAWFRQVRFRAQHTQRNPGHSRPHEPRELQTDAPTQVSNTRDFFKVPVRLSCFNLIQLHPDTLLSLHHHVIKTSFRVSKHVEKVLKNPQSQFPLSLHRGSGQRGTDQERQSSLHPSL